MTTPGARLTWALLAWSLWLLHPSHASGQSRITRISPDTGPMGGGTRVTMEVEGGVTFGPLRVEFGGRPAGAVDRLDFSTLQATTPAGRPGPVAVQVINELWGTSTAPAVFTYVPPPPRLIRLHPSAVPAGSGDVELAVEGEDLAATGRLRVGGSPVPSTFLDPQHLRARIPAALLARAGSLDVRVIDTGLGGGVSNVVALTVANPPPHLTAVEAPPLRAGGGAALVTVRGRAFRPESFVSIAGTALPTRYASEGELTATIPADMLARPGELPVMVVTPDPGGGTSNPMTLSVPASFPGRFLVFTSNRRGGRNHVYLLDRQAGRLDPLEEANSVNASDGYPSISADGRFIVFQSNRHRGQDDVFLFDRETRQLDPLPELNDPIAFDGFPHISPDGRLIVFESDRLNGRPKIFLFDRQTRTLSELGQANEVTADDGLAAISN